MADSLRASEPEMTSDVSMDAQAPSHHQVGAGQDPSGVLDVVGSQETRPQPARRWAWRRSPTRESFRPAGSEVLYA